MDRIEPGSVNAGHLSVVAGDRGDERGIAAPAARLGAVGQRMVKSKCRESAAADAAGEKIGFTV